MIIKIINNDNSKSATSALNYCLSMKDSNKVERSVAPKILNGDIFTTKEIDKDCKKCTSLVLAFRDNEEITKEQKEKLIDDFEKFAFGNMRNRVNAIYIEHRDKENLEIHVIINKKDLETGKAYNPFPPGQMTKDFKDAFCALKNDELGFKQIIENPLKTKFSSNERKCKTSNNHNFKNLDTKINLDNAIRTLVKDNIVNNKQELVKYLKEELGLNVHRNNDDFISIKTSEGKNIRLKGGIYSNHDNKSYDEIKQTFNEEKQKLFDREKTLSTFNRILEARNKYNSARYDVKATSKAPKFEKQGQEQASKASSAVAEQTPQHSTENTPNSVPGASQEQKNNDSQGSTGEDKPRAVSSAGLGGGGSSAIGAQMSVDKALADLSNAKTYAEVARAKSQLAIATANLNRVLQSIEEERKRSLNRMKI